MANPNCPQCQGQGFVFQGGVFDGQQMGGNVPCACVEPVREETLGETVWHLLCVAFLLAAIAVVALRAKGVG